MALAQREGEDRVVFGLETGQNIRLKLQVLVVADQAGIAVDRHEADVALAADDGAHRAAVGTGFEPHLLQIDDAWAQRNALGHRRQAA
jgi:hypothetical protein